MATPALILLPPIGLILLSERRLDPKAIPFLLIGASSYIGKHAIMFSLGQKSAGPSFWRWTRAIQLLALLVCATGAIFCIYEGQMLVFRGGFHKILTTVPVHFLLPTVVLSVFDALSNAQYCQETRRDVGANSGSSTDIATSKAAMDVMCVFISSFSFFLQTPTWVQVLSYGSVVVLTSIVSLLLRPSHPSSQAEELELEDYNPTAKLLPETDQHAPKARQRVGYCFGFNLKLWVFLLGLIGTKVSLERPTRENRIDDITSIRPITYIPQSSRRLDVVVSHYNEDPTSIKSFIDNLKEIPTIRGLDPNVIIYTKNNEIDPAELKQASGAAEVTALPNRGREGGTYLHHIINNWGNLANQTIFIQAHPHVPNRVLRRLEKYFYPLRTGMLDLGYRDTRGCNCLDCRDEHGWVDEAGIIPELMAKAHHIKCDANTKVSISYAGQFVVSHQRIWAIKKSVYESLNDRLVGENRIKLGGDEDSPDAPFFGYTIERSWNALFQCADLTGVRDMCPGLAIFGSEFADLRPPTPEDCGCLDE
ncbi:hypothetical protein H072_9272 [Dactylellina haptotyla CBS 200.50]|uniref:Uncharacterized protein n=1 Tax=Dactylellina haptotyla (strain CBS 200.50) TaxID=1284197 RepID=S8A293_DACHA|nr:hypothetical protein H072_9272 [Dactylellina haptotyla CBS 200.50]